MLKGFANIVAHGDDELCVLLSCAFYCFGKCIYDQTFIYMQCMFYILYLLHVYGCRYRREFGSSLALHYLYAHHVAVVYMKYDTNANLLLQVKCIL